MESNSVQERRKYPRVDSNIVISYHIQGEYGNYDLSQTRNISQGGILLTTNREFKKGDYLGMTVLFPFLDDKIEIVGEVIASREVVKDFVYETQVKFNGLKEQLLEQLGQFINESKSDE